MSIWNTIQNGIDNFGKAIGNFWNNITGKTAQREAEEKYNTAERIATQQFNSAEALKQRDWETEMSNTAHQREVADMEAAGINPLLSAGGGGATTPSGASASSGMSSVGNTTGGLGEIGSILAGTASIVNAANGIKIANKNAYSKMYQSQMYASSAKMMRDTAQSIERQMKKEANKEWESQLKHDIKNLF